MGRWIGEEPPPTKAASTAGYQPPHRRLESLTHDHHHLSSPSLLKIAAYDANGNYTTEAAVGSTSSDLGQMMAVLGSESNSKTLTAVSLAGREHAHCELEGMDGRCEGYWLGASCVGWWSVTCASWAPLIRHHHPLSIPPPAVGRTFGVVHRRHAYRIHCCPSAPNSQATTGGGGGEDDDDTEAGLATDATTHSTFLKKKIIMGPKCGNLTVRYP